MAKRIKSKGRSERGRMEGTGQGESVHTEGFGGRFGWNKRAVFVVSIAIVVSINEFVEFFAIFFSARAT